jgi:hypothetical protein
MDSPEIYVAAATELTSHSVEGLSIINDKVIGRRRGSQDPQSARGLPRRPQRAIVLVVCDRASIRHYTAPRVPERWPSG